MLIGWLVDISVDAPFAGLPEGAPLSPTLFELPELWGSPGWIMGTEVSELWGSPGWIMGTELSELWVCPGWIIKAVRGGVGTGPGSRICMSGRILWPRTLLVASVNFCSKGLFDPVVIGARVTSRLGIPRLTSKSFWPGLLIDTGAVSVRSGLALKGEFHFGNLAIGTAVGVWGWCSEVLFIVGSVLELTAALRAALFDIARGVGSALYLFVLLPGWCPTAGRLSMAIGLLAGVGFPVDDGPFAGKLTWLAPLTAP